jgi:hypothetical protein
MHALRLSVMRKLETEASEAEMLQRASVSADMASSEPVCIT